MNKNSFETFTRRLSHLHGVTMKVSRKTTERHTYTPLFLIRRVYVCVSHRVETFTGENWERE